MAKVGKLTKLKSAIKRWPSFTKFSRTTSSTSSGAATAAASYSPEMSNKVAAAAAENGVVLRAVYVGKARRRYLLSSEVVEHPVFQRLVDKSVGVGGEDDAVSVACEVVLFEHLLWMLENNAEAQLGSTDDLVGFYTCPS